MLSGSAILRVAILVAVAAVLAGAFQLYWPGSSGEIAPESASVSAPRVTARPAQKASEPASQAARPSVAPAAPNPPPTMEQAQISPTPSASAPSASVPSALVPSASAPITPPAVAPAPAFPAPSPAPAPSPPTPSLAQIGQDSIDAATDSAGPRAIAIVDLNTGTLAELNRLKGGGAIGRAIIQRRPYASVDQLLSKRVLSRATYAKIKDQVTVR